MKNYLWVVLICSIACAPKFLERIEAGREDERAAVIYERGNTYFKQKDYKRAILEFEEILDRYEKSDAYEPSLYLTAFSYFKLNRFEQAASLGEKFVKEFPNSSYLTNAISLLGESYFKLAEDYKATYYLTKFYIVSDDSSSREAAFERILKLLPELSVSELEKLHRMFMVEPIDEHILYNLAQIEAREGKKEEAERDFNLLLRRFPNTDYTYEVREYVRFIGLGEATGRAGILLPLTGRFADYGRRLLDIVRIFENRKTLPFSLHVLDTRSDPIEAIVAALKLIEDIHVDFLVGPIFTIEALGVCGLASGKGIPVILPMVSDTRFESIPNIFTTQGGEEQAQAIARYGIYDLGIKKFAIVYPDIANYQRVAHVFANEVVKHNREVVAMYNFHPDSITMKYPLEEIAEKEPEALFLAMDTDMIINSAPQIAYYGMEEVTLLGISTFKNERVPRLGEKYVEGSIFATSALVDTSVFQQLSSKDYKEDEFATKFISVLWQLKNIKEYDRNVLPKIIASMLERSRIFSIYRVHDGEFVKLTEMSQ